MATVRKVRAGISLDADVAQELDSGVSMLNDPSITRSDVVNAILSDYFEGNGSSETVLGAIGKKRAERR
ncbi:MAG: hypothetical protein JRM99_05975 [Nitrososphaerota archaeon]|nr:hypothetical protein [Nitrososphaerota archaeon]